MRLIAIAIAAVVLVAGPANAAWKSYKYPQYGFGVDFPAEPTMSMGTYRGAVAGQVPTTIISAEADNTTYQVILADFSKRMPETPGILEEAAFLLTQEGDLVSDTTARSEAGAKAHYGRRITVKTKDGGKKITEVYLVNGRLMEFQGVISPKGDVDNPEAARFQDSIIYDLNRDWNIPPPLPANAADGPRILKPLKPGDPGYQAAK